MLRGDYVLGVDWGSVGKTAFDVSALQALAVQLIAQGSEADGISVATDINAATDEMIGRLVALGGQDALVATGTAIENDAYDLVANYDPNIGDPSVPGKAAALQTRMNAWQSQAWGPLRNAPPAAGSPGAPGVPAITSITDAITGAPSGAPGDSVTINGSNFTGTTAVDFNGVPAQFQVVSPTQIAASVPQGTATGPVHVTNAVGTGVSAFTVTAAAPPYVDPGGGYSGGSSGGGGFGDDGGDTGDPGGIDWGDGDPGPADRGGGGGLDDVGPASADQGIDWGDDQTSDDRALDQQRSSSAMATADDGGELDPFADMLPDDESDGADTQAEDDVVGSQYLRGVDVVLGAGSDVVGDEVHPPFDNTQIYRPGDIVTYWGQWWQATRDVLPPMLPMFMKGEVPGSSDAWRSMSALEVANNVLGADTIPSAGAVYTDKKTVGAVQTALNDHGFGPLKVDGIMGPKTAAAIRKMQAAASIPATGVIDSGVIAALQVTPGVLPPGVTLQQKTDVEVQAAIDAATAVEHSVTPADLQAAAAKVVDAAPPAPPELKQEAQQAHAAVLMATTPAAQAAAKQQVQAVAQKVQAAVAPGWWSSPLWQGAPVNRMQGIIGGVGAAAIVAGVIAAVRR
jgi:peptidoglycan hydrolase-like protein with peptidoglycan-binding domain